MNRGIIHLNYAQRGGRPLCNTRRAIMCTTPARIESDQWGWEAVCKKCAAQYRETLAKVAAKKGETDVRPYR